MRNFMKNFLKSNYTFFLFFIAFSISFLVSGCTRHYGGNVGNKEVITLKVGASQVPHAEILQFVKNKLKKENVNLEIKVFNDYVLPNKYLEEGLLDANFFQHEHWLNVVLKNQKYHLVKVTGVHIEPIGAYSKKINNIEELKSNGKSGYLVAIPNGVSEITRSLLLLNKHKLIVLDNLVGQKSIRNITKNPYNLRFKLLDPSMLPRVISDVDIAVINTNYVLQAGLNPLKDALFLEDKKSPYVNILVTKKGKEREIGILKLAKELRSKDTKTFILTKYKGAIIPVS